MTHGEHHADWTILVFNVGSSSLSFKLYRHAEVLASGKCHRVGVKGIGESCVEFLYAGASFRRVVELPDHVTAARYVFDWLDDSGGHADAAGHRFADGGGYFVRGTLVDDTTRPVLEQCVPLAPLHNRAALDLVDEVESWRPGIVQYVVFDSTFHSTLPEVASAYALPADLARRFRKHGFHGLSYADVVEKAAWYLGEERCRAVVLHLGTGGSSACAVVDGQSVDTSMGYSPLQGLVMNTRCGDLDPGIVLELVYAGYSSDALSRLLHRESGLYGLSGCLSSDIRDLLAAAPENRDAKLAFELYVYRIKQYVGAYAAAMGGIDLLLFTDDVGLRVPEVRSEVCRNMEFLGLHLDETRNRVAVPDHIEPLHLEGSPVRILAVPNDEERAIYAEGVLLLV